MLQGCAEQEHQADADNEEEMREGSGSKMVCRPAGMDTSFDETASGEEMNEARLIILKNSKGRWVVSKIGIENNIAYQSDLKSFKTQKEAQTYLRKL